MKISLFKKTTLKEVLEQFEDLVNLVNDNKNEETKFDFSAVNWITPQQSVYLCSILSDKLEMCHKESIGSYLQTINFPQGILIDKESDIRELFTKYKGKSYIPVFKLKLEDASDESEVRSMFLKYFLEYICDLLSFKSNYVNGIRYILADLLTNIFEHSESIYAYFTFQNYPILKKMEICVCDVGLGLLETYVQNKNNLKTDFSHITTHLEAMKSVIGGLSTKSIERGFGVHTSRNMVYQGFNGTFIYQSGNALSINESISKSNCNIDGVIFSLNIPYDDIDDSFDYINFVE